MEIGKPQKHLILVHGACHGAWCWYKLKPLLEASGHKVTALDLSASGINMRKIHEISSFHDYSLPLLEFMDSLPPNEKVILVGHSFGGVSLALAMDKYPEKVQVAVFLSALLPDSDHAPSYVLDQLANRTASEEWLDTQFLTYDIPGKQPLSFMILGPKFLSSKLYQHCSAEDVALANMLTRPGSLFMEDLSKANKFSREGFGSIKKVYIVCNENAISEEFQCWQIENNGGDIDVMEMNDVDHMPMLSKPQQLFNCLVNVANKYN